MNHVYNSEKRKASLFLNAHDQIGQACTSAPSFEAREKALLNVYV